MLNAGIQPSHADRNHAARKSAKVVQITVDMMGKRMARFTVPNLGGPLEKCRRQIEALQAKFPSSGYNAEGGYWWARLAGARRYTSASSSLGSGVAGVSSMQDRIGSARRDMPDRSSVIRELLAEALDARGKVKRR